MEVSFAKNPETNPSVPVAAPQAAAPVIDINPPVTAMPATVVQPPTPPVPAPAPTPAPVPAPVEGNRSLQPTGFMLGDRLPTFADVIMPRINMVQGLGELKDSFTQGAIVFNQQFEIYTPQTSRKVGGVDTIVPGTAPLNVICLGLRPDRYAEKIAGGKRGLLVNTEAEVRAAGGTLDYSEWKLKASAGMKRFEPLAEALIIIEKPINPAVVDTTPLDEEPVFIYEVEGKRYTMALWAMKGTAYTEGAKKAFMTNRRTGCLRNGYPTYSFTLATRLKAYDNGNETWIPVLLPKVKTSAALLEFAKSVLTAN